MTEKSVECRLVKRVEKLGGKAYKFVSPGSIGVPDRMVCLPGGRVIFVETKRPKDGKLSKIQNYRIKELQDLGCQVEVINTTQMVEEFIERLTNEI